MSKRCPFCGGEGHDSATTNTQISDNGARFSISIKSCGCPKCDVWADEKTWERRGWFDCCAQGMPPAGVNVLVQNKNGKYGINKTYESNAGLSWNSWGKPVRWKFIE